MKCLKMLAAAAVTMAALMAFAGPASATVLQVTTEGGVQDIVDGHSTITAELKAGTEASLKSSFIGEVKCSGSTIVATVTNPGSPTTTVTGDLTWTFTLCNGTVIVVKGGTFELHTEITASSNGNGTLTWNGGEVTVELAGLHCIYTSSNTDIGQLIGTHEGHVEYRAESVPIPRTGGRSGAFCGSSATWRASYTITRIHWGGQTFTNFTVI